MKKYTSAALLALKLTWKAAALTFVLFTLIQTGAVWQELMPGGVPLQTTFGFENLLESAVQGAGKWAAVVLLAALILTASRSRGSKTIYTLNRLGLSEMQVSFVFGGVFSLYFLLYWAFQLGLCYGFFAWYSRQSLVSSNIFMLACWRSEWLHILLPLGEWIGYLRNLILCVSFGFTAAFGAQLLRHGSNALICCVPPILCAFALSGRMVSKLELIQMGLLIAYSVGIVFLAKGGEDHEIL